MKPETLIISFVAEKATSEPNVKRIKLYRALALMLPRDQRPTWESIADQLEELEEQAHKQSLQLALDLH